MSNNNCTLSGQAPSSDPSSLHKPFLRKKCFKVQPLRLIIKMNDELRSLRKVSFDLLQGGGIPIQQQHTKNIYPSNKCQLDLGWGQVLVRSAPSPFPPRAVYHNNHGGFSFFSLSLLVRFVSFRVFPVRLCVCFLDGLTLKGTYVHSRPFQDSSELCSIFSRSFDC